MLSVAEARSAILAKAGALKDLEWVPLEQARGRILARAVNSSLDIPPADNSAMDGFALRWEDLQTNRTLAVSQRVAAGHAPIPLLQGTVCRIFTGGEIPIGADTVVPQEQCEYLPDDALVRVLGEIKRGENVRPRGQDVKCGDTLLQASQPLRPQDIGLLAAVGIAQVEVFRRPRVALLSSGDELVSPGVPLKPGQIYDSNRHMLAALIEDAGCEVISSQCLADDLAQTRAALLNGAQTSDLILSSGGVSVGEEDHLRNALIECGSLELWKVAVKPGKPLAVGQVGGVPYFGLPGNPVSSFVTFKLFVQPFLNILCGNSAAVDQVQLVAAGFVRPAQTREEYLRVQVRDGVAQLHPNQSSGVASSLVWADGLVRHPANTLVCEGDALHYFPI